jgi:hypothetical protein
MFDKWKKENPGRCPACGEKMQEPLTAKTCDRKSGPTKWEKLWLCQKDGYLNNGKVSHNPFGDIVSKETDGAR